MEIDEIIKGLKETILICDSVYCYDRKKYIDAAIDILHKYEPTTKISFPEGATNKDIFKAIFGYEPATDSVVCNKEDWCGASEPCNYCKSNPNNIGREENWWNAEYKEPTTKNDLGQESEG